MVKVKKDSKIFKLIKINLNHNELEKIIFELNETMKFINHLSEFKYSDKDIIKNNNIIEHYNIDLNKKLIFINYYNNNILFLKKQLVNIKKDENHVELNFQNFK